MTERLFSPGRDTPLFIGGPRETGVSRFCGENPAMFLFKTRVPAPLTGEKVNLRILRKEDFDSIYRWLDDPELMELAFGISTGHPNFETLVPAYKKEIGDYQKSFFGIENKNSEFIGFCSHSVFNLEGRARIGIIIGDRSNWNKGYGREAVSLLLHYLFTERNVKCVELDTAIKNERAQRCFMACGFQRIHREWSESNDRIWFELSKEDYKRRLDEHDRF